MIKTKTFISLSVLVLLTACSTSKPEISSIHRQVVQNHANKRIEARDVPHHESKPTAIAVAPAKSDDLMLADLMDAFIHVFDRSEQDRVKPQATVCLTSTER